MGEFIKQFTSFFSRSILLKAINEIKHFLRVCEAKDKLEKYNIGCIGEPTKWPLTLANKKAIRKLGPKNKIVKIRRIGERA